MFYAQLDNSNIVVGISQLSDAINLPNMIKIETFDSSLCGKKYNNGEFNDVPQIPISNIPAGPMLEELTEELLLETKYQTALLEMMG